MALKVKTWSARIARRLRQRADEIEPPASDADIAKDPRYRTDPVQWAKDVLGIWLSPDQCRILRAIATHQRVSVVSGHKVGKSTAIAVAALWFYAQFPRSRVVITATTDNQVNGILWREVKWLVRHSRVPLPGAKRIHELAHSGLIDPDDQSEIRGYTAKEGEAIAGVSGAYLMYLVDEASGVKDHIFDAIEGNRAANARIVLTSNPTKAEGEFYASHHSKARSERLPHGYECIHIDSRNSPNVTGEWRKMFELDRDRNSPTHNQWIPRTTPVPGMAMPEWVAEKLLEEGEDSAWFKVRVAGKFVVAEQGRIFPIALITESQQAWPDAKAEGQLQIGVDPAGDGNAGDESAFCVVRGKKMLALVTRTGISEDAHVAIVQQLLAEHSIPLDAKVKPVVALDCEGAVGAKVYGAFAAVAGAPYDLIRVRAGKKAVRQPQIYPMIRDELAASARQWVRDGGAMMPHARLEKDLHAPQWHSLPDGRQKMTSKDDLRKTLGRSPDCGDAFFLAVWRPLAVRYDAQAAAPPPPPPSVYDETRGQTIDPYGGMTWGR